MDYQSTHEEPNKLLVVDDEPMIRDLLRDCLKTQGYTVLTAATGEEALAVYAAQKKSIRLVITDLSMPGMGGKALIRELLRCNPQVRILVCSGSCNETAAEDLLRQGVDSVFFKPYLMRHLLLEIRSLLECPTEPNPALNL